MTVVHSTAKEQGTLGLRNGGFPEPALTLSSLLLKCSLCPPPCMVLPVPTHRTPRFKEQPGILRAAAWRPEEAVESIALSCLECLSTQMLPVGPGAPEGKVGGGAYYVDQALSLSQGQEQGLVLLKIADLASHNYYNSEQSPNPFLPPTSPLHPLKGPGLRPPSYLNAPTQRP